MHGLPVVEAPVGLVVNNRVSLYPRPPSMQFFAILMKVNLGARTNGSMVVDQKNGVRLTEDVAS